MQNSDGKSTLAHLKGLERSWGVSLQADIWKFKNPFKRARGRRASPEEHSHPCSSSCGAGTAGTPCPQPCPQRSRTRHRPLSPHQRRGLNTGWRLENTAAAREGGDSVIYVSAPYFWKIQHLKLGKMEIPASFFPLHICGSAGWMQSNRSEAGRYAAQRKNWTWWSHIIYICGLLKRTPIFQNQNFPLNLVKLYC